MEPCDNDKERDEALDSPLKGPPEAKEPVDVMQAQSAGIRGVCVQRNQLMS